jgi:hypothetical protein
MNWNNDNIKLNLKINNFYLRVIIYFYSIIKNKLERELN